MSDDALSILYGGTGETVSPVPDWHKAETAGAAVRLAGKGEGSETPPADDLAKTLYGEGSSAFREDDADTHSWFDGLIAEKIKDGDKEHVDYLAAGKAGLIADLVEAKTPQADFSNALGVVNEYMSRDLSADERASIEASSMAELQNQYGDDLGKSLAAARQLIADLDTVSPGLIDTLERSGAGNDRKLVQLAIGEAKRRGYLK
ncbi:MAG: hypothetical protein ACOZAM_23745 [Pseudomonadota bacterium]